MSSKNGGQALVAALVSAGVDTIFGIPGTHSLPIYDALVDTPEIRHIMVRHEQGAAFMADGYARSTGKVGVCLTTTGPAALNTFSALATAYGDSCPVLLLCSQIDSDHIGKDKGALHELPDQLGMLERLTCFSARPNSVQEIVDKLQEAMHHAQAGRPRPVALELPADVLCSHDEVTIPASSRPSRPAASPDEIDEAIRLIARAKRPIIWAGGGVVSSGAHAELATLAGILQAPVLTTNLGKGALPADHPLHLGYIYGQKPAADYMSSCDLMLAIGARFSYLDTSGWTLKLPDQMIHIDIDADVIGKNYPATLGIVGDAASVLQALISQLSNQQSTRSNRVGEVSLIKEQVCDIWQEQLPLEFQLIRDIRAALPRDTIFSLEPTMGAYSAWQMLDIYEPRSYLYPMLGATLGYSLPAALGAKVANPDRPVVTICGDAGFMLCCQELATAVQYGINTVTLVFNDNGYGVLRIQQDKRFGRRSEVDLVNPDFVALARSFGVESMRIDEPGHLKAALVSAIEAEKPTLIEMPVALAVQWN